MANVTGLASYLGRTVNTKTGLRELIKTRPEFVILVPVNKNWTPADFAVKGSAVQLPTEHTFTVTPYHGKWTAKISYGKNGLTVK